MGRLGWKFYFSLGLIGFSALLYFIHFVIFQDARHIFIYLLGDLAFIPLDIIVITLILHELLKLREKNTLLKKLNMVIGVFFSETGTTLLKFFSKFDPESQKISQSLIISNEFTSHQFANIEKNLKMYEYCIECNSNDLEEIHKFLVGKRGFLVGLLENPNLLEHESFTDLLWAVFHLTEELDCRKDLKAIPIKDQEHLIGDIKRAYSRLISEWLAYMKHLKINYPYLFYLALRTNPFDPAASPIVT